MRRLLLAALLTLLVLAVPAAQAKPPKLSPHASPVSAAGVMTVEVANPNAYALRGTATVSVGPRTIARRGVRLGKLSVRTIELRFSANALYALREAGGRARISLRVRRPGGRLTTARRALRLRLPSGGTPAPAPGDGGSTGSGSGPSPTPSAPPASNRWVGRMGTEGPYDDLEITAAGGQMQITKVPAVPVSCFENGGSFRSAISFELFASPGPWTVGTDLSAAKQGIAVNQLVSGGARTITYKVTGTSQQAGRIAGTLGMSFVDSRYDIFTNTITFINCAGAQSFEAVPAS